MNLDLTLLQEKKVSYSGSHTINWGSSEAEEKLWYIYTQVILKWWNNGFLWTTNRKLIIIERIDLNHLLKGKVILLVLCPCSSKSFYRKLYAVMGKSKDSDTKLFGCESSVSHFPAVWP